MTEKRFSMKGSTILENNEEITAWDCCDLLNELSDENEQLKGEVAHYKLILMSLEQEAKRISSIRSYKNE